MVGGFRTYDLVTIDASDHVPLRVANLLGLLDVFFRRCSGFRRLLLARHAAAPSSPESPWSLIIYGDEVTPGAELTARNFRKFWAIYVSFKEFDPLTLSNDKAWFTICVKESHEVSKISAGISQVFKAVLKDLFCGATDPELVGVALGDPSGCHTRLHFKLGVVLMDGDAHRGLWCCKGDSGSKLCMLCLNLYAQGSGIAQEDGSDMLCCSLVHERELLLASDADIHGTLDRLAAHKLTDTKTHFSLREQAAGFRYEPESVLMDPELRSVVLPVTSVCHDTQHAWFSSGVFNTVVYLFFETLWLGGMKGIYEAAHTYISEWRLPHSSGSAKGLYEVFSKTRVKAWRAAKHLKCSAAEALSLYPILTLFVMKIVMPAWPNQCNAFLRMADVIDLFACVSFGIIDPEDLGVRMTAFSDSCIAAGWREFLHPKFHWLVHMRGHFVKFGWLPSCWTLERKHKVPKSFAVDAKNTKIFDKTVLNETLCQQIAEMSSEDMFDAEEGLDAPYAAPRKMREFLTRLLMLTTVQSDDIQTSAKARFSYIGSCNRGDIVMVKVNSSSSLLAAEVCFLANVDGSPVALLSVLSKVSDDESSRSSKWESALTYRLYPLQDIACVCAYKRYGNHVVLITPPYVF